MRASDVTDRVYPLRREATPKPMNADRTKSEPDDADLFLRLLTQNERRVYAFILSLIPNWADADEILQETNVRLWKEFGRFAPDSDFGAWACTVARFQVMTWRTHRKRDRIQFGDAFIEAVASETRVISEEADERRVALARCIEQLTPVNRDLLRAYYAAETQATEVAKRFNRSMAALYKALSRIRRFLHGCINRQIEGTA
jgi:RNA polymerase sigma-70 factor, ECF subfamily